jgi:stage III sporulation protein AC
MSGMGIDIDIIFKIAGVGLIVAFIHTILDQVGKKEYSQWVILVSFIYILFNVAQVVGQLIDRIKSVFLFQ